MSNTTNLAFQKKIFVAGSLTAFTGLHVGGNSVDMSIGGADLIVVRDPITNRPYVPGSSLRGKMRSLLERHRGEMTIKFDDANFKPVHRIQELEEVLKRGGKIKSAGPATDTEAASAKLFGVAIDTDTKGTPMPQRLVVRDAFLTCEGLRKLESARNTDMPLTEVKTEVTIDRLTSQANPRQIERVPAGAEFAFEFILNLYGQDSEEEFLGLLWECMELLQDDYLGGHGSRGYGKIKFSIKSVTVKTIEDYKANAPGRELEVSIPDALREKETPCWPTN